MLDGCSSQLNYRDPDLCICFINNCSENLILFFALQIEEEVAEAIQKWELENHKDFLVDGMKFPEYLKNQWENFQLQKEQQKQSRVNIGDFDVLLFLDCWVVCS